MFHGNRSALVQHKALRAQIQSILQAWGMDADSSHGICEAMVETDLRGIDSHGVSMLPLYDQMRRAGKINVKAKPRVLSETPVVAVIDADAGLGHAVSRDAMTRAVDKAKAGGCGIVAVRNSHHFGAAGIYAETAAKRGAIGLVATSTRFIAMVPTFASAPVLGTNPLAFAAPTGDPKRPVVLDMATTSVAAGQVKTHWLNDCPIPPGWVVDQKGEPVTDSDCAHKIIFENNLGGLSPLGGTRENGSHKGYGLALMVHILGGALTGSSFSPIRNRTQQPADPDNIGHLFLAIDPKAFRETGAFEKDLDAVVDTLRAAPRADAGQPVLVAGDPERACRLERLEQGVPVPRKLLEQIETIAEQCGAEFLLDTNP